MSQKATPMLTRSGSCRREDHSSDPERKHCWTMCRCEPGAELASGAPAPRASHPESSSLPFVRAQAETLAQRQR